ncbi:alkaline phosphatase family protein [Clostridium tyrobutyricum]|uniref:alkaline phosphatase family protein n=1 Tax=Clostridium tyrobutyricum TaxID=1519 RepID=UPI0002DC0A30|nr:alkaline phosphatase family protein [Clostridium tyrobutyricum]MBV4423747.1 alkaline phosphatase family protein [Clostridium tyrobutyricum]MBV4436176.1 alkaline phosphatase family protein [Clostridium tyrobutyricum]MEA5008103.1 alkaline phosphatase family protein [Clostridium tyrobutyricum]
MSNNNIKTKKVLLLGLDGADALQVKKYVSEGKLPNFKKVISQGVTTKDYSMRSVLPAITPPNWASLATGAFPNTHGITCFWNHTLGNPLDQLDYGFDSRLLKAETIWEAYARSGKKSILFNYPTAWPPKTEDDIYVDGTSIYTNLRGYIDYEKVYNCIEGDFPIKEVPHILDNTGTDCRVEGEVNSVKADISKSEYDGYGYTAPDIVTSEENGESSSDLPNADQITTPIKFASDWKNAPDGAKEVILPVNSGMTRRYGLIVTEDGKNYNKIKIYASKKDEEPIGEAKAGEWSSWIYDTYRIDGKNTKVAYKIRVIDIKSDGSKLKFYYSFVLDLNKGKYFYPDKIGKEIYDKVGPMLQPTNYDRLNKTADEIMLESITEMYDWHVKAINYLLNNKEWDLFYIHMHGIDMYNHFYLDYTFEETSEEYKRYQDLIYKIYELSDKFIGEMLKRLDGETTIFIVSDHGGVGKNPKTEFPLIGDMWGINTGIMGQLGYTKLKEENGKLQIDWKNTTAISQRATFIYVNLKGRDPEGIVAPEDYDALVEKIIDDLYNYRDHKTGKRVISFALNRKDMEVLGLGGENSGDIFYILEPEFTRCHGNGLSNHELLGYSMRALFAAVGAGIKKGEIIDRNVGVVDIVPTISHLTGVPVPKNTEGGIIYQALEE